MADIQKMVDAVLTVYDHEKTGALDAIIDADWHPEHLKPDSESPYDKAVSAGTAELAGLSQAEKFQAISDVVDALTTSEAVPTWLQENILNWAGNIKLGTFRPDMPAKDATVEDATVVEPSDDHGFPIAD